MTKLKYKYADNMFFDDYEINTDENLNYGWTQICDNHSNELHNNSKLDCNSGSGICGVYECNRKADHYLDLDKEDVQAQ